MPCHLEPSQPLLILISISSKVLKFTCDLTHTLRQCL